MKANEYVKKYGIDEAKKWLQENTQLDHVYMGNGFYIEDLKILISAHEVIEKMGGLDDAKDEYFSRVQNNEDAGYLNKAIADVESCQ